ncbi:unnamed protein product [Moneuplotes crassus]|uniref:O-acyltransferase WSD1 C-terminal domain-containing protein n=1 Tax=Euplotes crassus TaxID=5936 RepID=A0AAD1UKU3_EUPCR|nr:unnamed protein product [Moneuplotes crassus]
MALPPNILAGIIHIGIYLFILCTCGILPGIFVIFALYKLADILLWKFFNVKIMRGTDVIMYLEEPKNTTICTCALILDKNEKSKKDLDGQDHYTHLREKYLINHFGAHNEVFRSVMIEKFGMKFWKVLPDTPKTKKITGNRIKKIDHDMKTEEDLVKYLLKFSEIPMPRGELQWDLHVHENYKDDKMVMFARAHHGILDGMGTMCFLSSIDGNSNMPAIPEMKDISFSLKALLFVISPILFVYSLFIDISVKNDPSPYTLKSGYSGKKALEISKTYHFDQLRKCYKSYNNAKFNDFFVGCIGKGMKQYAKELGYPDFQTIGVGVPVNLRPLPKDLEVPLPLQNCIGLGECEFPCSDDLQDGMKRGRKVLQDRFKVSLMWSSQNIQALLKFMPNALNDMLIKILSKSGQMVVSNISGLKQQITIGKYLMSDSYFITPNVFKAGISILGVTYNSKFRYCVYQDAGLEAKASKTMENIEKVIEQEIEKVK